MNNKADSLAKLTLNDESEDIYIHPWFFSKEYITLNSNNFICNNKKKIIKKKTKDKMEIDFKKSHTRFDWNQFINESYPNKWIDTIHPKYSNFLIKLLSKALPTLSYMRIVYPDYYDDNLCPNCNVRETDYHIFHECKEYQNIRNNIWSNIKETFSQFNIDIIHNWFNDNSNNNKIPLYAGLIPKIFELNTLHSEIKNNLFRY